ncbi:MAG TPA: alanine--glyoxylate aminotransferase family protein [Anaerolineae bacterium]|jgi:aspartate aminotransferase-like enzyme|nr:alanine--glyoxylate aminotransferase family protein [Anaerolineae bacterium]
MRKEYMMTPGPTPVPAEVLLSQARPMFHHRTPAFTELLVSVEEGLKYVFQTKNDVLIFASSGTGMMESSVANLLSPGDKVICCSNGKFGDRFVKINEAYGMDIIKLEYEWDQVVKPEDIRRELDANPDVRAVFVVQSETSTGILNDVEAIGAIVKDYDAVLVVDSITGIGAVECKTDEWHLDVVMTGSQKGLMMPPGLACVAVSDKAWAAVEKSRLPKFYFSWKKAADSLHKSAPTTPFTPPISLIVGLGEVIKLMRQEGLENIIKRHTILAEAARQGSEAMGLKLFAPIEGRGNAVTPVWVPDGIDGGKLVKLLKEKYGITVAGGQGHLKGRIFRIGHLGYFDKFDIITTLAGVEMVLSELSYPVTTGVGVQAAEKVFMES